MPKHSVLGGASHSGQEWHSGEEKRTVSPPPGSSARQDPANAEDAIATALIPKDPKDAFKSPFEIAQYIATQIRNSVKIRLDAERILRASKLKPKVKEKVGEYLADLLDE